MTRFGMTPFAMMPWRMIRPLMVVLAFGLLLAACGKKGPPDPPGPPDKVIYPRSYPRI
jgi:predicted small lipoprotein YifL